MNAETDSSCHGRYARRDINLSQVPTVPFAWVDERTYAAIRGCSVQLVRHERRLGRGCAYRKINGTSIRYRLGDIHAFLENQPGGPQPLETVSCH